MNLFAIFVLILFGIQKQVLWVYLTDWNVFESKDNTAHLYTAPGFTVMIIYFKIYRATIYFESTD